MNNNFEWKHFGSVSEAVEWANKQAIAIYVVAITNDNNGNFWMVYITNKYH